jgi:hypothetical protein
MNDFKNASNREPRDGSLFNAAGCAAAENKLPEEELVTSPLILINSSRNCTVEPTARIEF